MAIKVTCPSCRHQLQAPASIAGKAGKCPHCSTTIPFPPRPPAPIPSEPIEGFDQIMEDELGGWGVVDESPAPTEPAPVPAVASPNVPRRLHVLSPGNVFACTLAGGTALLLLCWLSLLTIHAAIKLGLLLPP